MHLSEAADGYVVDAPVSVQLELDIEVDRPGPHLVISVGHESGPGVGALEGSKLASVGEVMKQVMEFHEAFDLPRQPRPNAHVGDVLAQLRVRLLREETEEFAEGSSERDLVSVADALADVVYVAYGSALTYGIDLDAVLREVHRSNMSKLDAAGRPVLRADGKVLKSNRYTPPAVDSVLAAQLPLFALSGDEDQSTALG